MTRHAHNWSQALGLDVADKRLAILQAVGDLGSISEAARQSGVSYKAAWQAIETLSNLSGAVLVERVVGGSGGGGAVLTHDGQRLLQAGQWLQQARAQALARLSTPDVNPQLALGGLGLRTSMRNQWPVVITAWRRQATGIRVTLGLDSGDTIHAAVTRESAQLMDLSLGQTLWALCKATAVSIAADGAEDPKGSNVVYGVVTRSSKASAAGEVSLQLRAGQRPGIQVVGFAAAGHGLRAGDRACAQWADAAVVLALGD